MRRLLLGAVLLILACGGAATLPRPSPFAVVERVTSPQVWVVEGGYTLVVFPERQQRPQGGILVQPPFAFYAVGSEARHIDIQQGFAEVMADVGARALPGAVSDR
jgi:hypothetical protein